LTAKLGDIFPEKSHLIPSASLIFKGVMDKILSKAVGDNNRGMMEMEI